MCRDFVFVRFHLLAFHFNEFRTCQTQPSSISRQTVEGSLGFEQTIKTSKVDSWFGLIGNQYCNRTKGTSFIAVNPHLDVILIVLITKGTPCQSHKNCHM